MFPGVIGSAADPVARLQTAFDAIPISQVAHHDKIHTGISVYREWVNRQGRTFWTGQLAEWTPCPAPAVLSWCRPASTGGQRSLFICFNNNLAISVAIWRTHVCAYQTVHRHRRATRAAECSHCASTPTANRAYSSPRSHL